MKGMKGAAILLAVLLTGCAGDISADLPETVPAEPLSVPAVVTEGRPWTEDGELPTELRGLRDWDQAAEPVAQLARTADAALYGLAGGEDRLLLRWGDALAEFDWPYRTPRTVDPRLWQVDADGDGAGELAVVCYSGSGTGVSIEQLHIVDKNEDGTLRDHCFPNDLWQEQFSRKLSVQTAEGRVFAVLGRELCDISEELDFLDPDLITGMDTGNTIGFRVEDGRICCLGTARITAEGYADGWYVAGLSADVSYKDGIFTLDHFHLDSLD